MERTAAAVYALLASGLFLKTFLMTGLQGRIRLGSKRFRWPEDAAAWGGVVGDDPDERVERAQAALRNDGENHPTMLAASAAWLALGAPVGIAGAAFGIYVVSRILHGLLLVHPIQPLRNRVYVLGLAILLAIVVDAVRRSIAILLV